VVHPASFDLAKLLWIPDGGEAPLAFFGALQFLHFVHKVSDLAEHCLSMNVPRGQGEHFRFMQTALACLVHGRAMYCPAGHVAVHREQIALFDP